MPLQEGERKERPTHLMGGGAIRRGEGGETNPLNGDDTIGRGKGRGDC